MFLNYLYIKNFKNIDEKEFNFSKINLISSENNGAGKTSILEAIIALTTNNWENKIEEYVQWGQKRFDIRGLFSLYDKNFDYSISYDRNTIRKLIVNNDEENAFKQSDCVEELRNYINPDIALYSNISLQGESTQLLKERPTPRLEKFKQFFNIKSINEDVEKIKNEIEIVRNEIKEKEILVNSLKTQKFIYQNVPERINYEQLTIEVKDLEIQKSKYDRDLKAFEEYKKKRIEYEYYIETKSDSEELIQLLNNQLKDFEKKLPEKKLEEIEEIISKLKENKKELENRKKQYEINIKKETQFRNELDKYEIEKSNIIIKRIQQLLFTEEELNQLTKDYQAKLKDFWKIKDHYEAIKNGKCPKCGAEYTSTNIEEIQQQMITLEKESKDLEIKLTSYKNQKSNYDKISQENELAKQKKDSLDRLIDNVKKQLSEVVGFNRDYNSIEVNNTLKKFDDDVYNFDKTCVEIKSIKKLRDDVEKEIIKFQTTLNNLKVIEEPIVISEPEIFVEGLLNDKKKQLNIAQEKEKEILRITEFNAKVKEQEKSILKQITEDENLLSEKRQRLTMLESAKKIVGKDFVAWKIDKGTNYVKDKMNELFQRMYGKYQIKFSKDNTGIDFYYANESKIWAPVNMASGYEKQALSISFRFALASLHRLGIFIFDEIDSDSNENNSIRLFKTILNQKYDQLFIITQKESTKEYLMNLPDCKEFEM